MERNDSISSLLSMIMQLKYQRGQTSSSQRSLTKDTQLDYFRDQERLIMKTIALLHPGNMGSTIGACAATSGARVLWASAQRSGASRRRAEQAGLVDAGDLAAAVRQSTIVLSVCPPEFAMEVAMSVAA